MPGRPIGRTGGGPIPDHAGPSGTRRGGPAGGSSGADRSGLSGGPRLLRWRVLGMFAPGPHPAADTRSLDMKPSARSIVKALIVVSCLSGSLTLVAEPPHDEVNTPLTAVSKRESYVFALTPDGLFRASLATKRWEKLKTPPEMPPNGTFAAQPGRSPLVIYVAQRSQADRTASPRLSLRPVPLARRRRDLGARLRARRLRRHLAPPRRGPLRRDGRRRDQLGQPCPPFARPGQDLARHHGERERAVPEPRTRSRPPRPDPYPRLGAPHVHARGRRRGLSLEGGTATGARHREAPQR